MKQDDEDGLSGGLNEWELKMGAEIWGLWIEFSCERAVDALRTQVMLHVYYHIVEGCSTR
jgi:hypothetical protein